MTIKNNRGFTLIELMVVVGIISVISLIAIPNFQRFQAKAKQVNARTELATIYGMEKAFFTEFGQYHNNVHLIGYTPDGYPDNGTCPVDPTSTGNGVVRFYATGFTGSAMAPPTGIGTAPCDVTFYKSTVDTSLAPATTAVVVAASSFIVESRGIVSAGKTDVWTINHSKALVNTAPGF